MVSEHLAAIILTIGVGSVKLHNIITYGLQMLVLMVIR